MSDWNTEAVTGRFVEAARTAHRLPPVRVQGYFNVWPQFVRTEFERMACEEVPMVRFTPSPTEIDRMLEVMGWVQWLEVEERKLLWMRAERYQWREIAKRFGCAERTAQRRWARAMGTITEKLCEGELTEVAGN
ncbi:MAG: hypothetical protein HO274_02285 [Ferrovum myxofaciens]|uniref:DUF6362 family protein n=1 Tax=Ferrovum myxofaciens TaxID=416213 RepID=UPI002354D21A|nr:DUF6362 family protein [Ferrovum myxofaciens]QKE40288.1 MAG: hypothetical protein HO274_02285 [Ferrovum myxofaciens]